MKIIGIAGGSGAGKSTVAYALVDAYPEQYEVINLDDYQKLKTDSNLPMAEGMINWDHPDIIRWDELLADIKKLQSGRIVTIPVWAHRSNLDYFKHGKMKTRTLQPKPILIIEGYLTLWHEPLRKLYSKSYYLELDEETRMTRRDKFVDPAYEQTVVKPMFQEFIEPTRKYAKTIIDVSKYNVSEIADMIANELL